MTEDRAQMIAEARSWAHSQAERLRRRTEWPGWEQLPEVDADSVDWVAQAIAEAREAARVERALQSVPVEHRDAYLAGRAAGRDDASHVELPPEVGRNVVEVLDRVRTSE